MFRCTPKSLRNLFARLTHPIRRSMRLSTEELEVRWVPANIAWDAANHPTGGSWDVATNWVGGAIPGANDDVTISLTTAGTVATKQTDSAHSITTNNKSTLDVNTGSLTIGAGTSTFAAPFSVDSGGTLNIGAGASIALPGGVTNTVNGALNVTNAASFKFAEAQFNNQGIVVGGSFTASGTTFSIIGGAAGSTTFIQVNSNASISATGCTFGTDVVALSNGSTLGVNQNNTFTSALYIPILDVPLLQQNTAFKDINLNSNGSFGSSSSIDLAPLGSNPAQDYIFDGIVDWFANSKATFTIPAGNTLNINANTKAIIGGGVTVTVNGTLTVNSAAPLQFNEAQFTNQGFIVNGSMTSTDTNYFINGGAAGSISFFQIGSTGTFSTNGSTFAVDVAAFSNGSTLGDNHNNSFPTTLFIPILDVPLLQDNSSFQDVELNSNGSFGSNATVVLTALGPNSSAQDYVFSGLSDWFTGAVASFTIPVGKTIDVDPNVKVLIAGGTTVAVAGAMNMRNEDSLITREAQFANQGILVTGTFTATNTAFSLANSAAGSTSAVQVSNGGKFTMVGGSYKLDTMLLAAGSNATMNFMYFGTNLQVNSASIVTIHQNDFTTSTITAAGAPTATIDFTNNYWSNEANAQIDSQITDHKDNAALPLINYLPTLSLKPVEPVGAAANAAYSGGPQTVTLSATFTTPGASGNSNVNEGTATFIIMQGTTVIGPPLGVTGNVSAGLATVLYNLPGGLLGGQYTIVVVYNGTANFVTATDSTQFLTIAPVVSNTVAVNAAVTVTGSSQSVLLTANLSSAAGTVIDGTVVFTIEQGTTVITTSSAITVVNGVAQGSIALPAGIAGGQYTIIANYSGSESFEASDNTASAGTLTLNQAASFTSVNNTTIVEGAAVNFQFNAAGFPAPTFTLDASSAALPTGLSLSATGLLSGIATVDHVFTIVVDASNGIGAIATQSFTITINSIPSFTSAINATFEVGTVGSFLAIATGFPAPTFTATGLPNGVLMAADGALSGNPQQFGVFNVTITATNLVQSVNQTFTLTVDAAPVITSANSFSFIQGVGGTFTFTATGFPAPVLSQTAALPTGVTFDSATGTLTVSAAAANIETTLTFVAANTTISGSQTATQSFSLTIGSGAAITSVNSATFALNDSTSSFTVTATGFPAPTFSETGTLPNGVTLDTATGVLSGTPTQSGSFAIVIFATNSLAIGQQSFTITVTDPPQITSASGTTFYTTALNAFAVAATGFPAPTYSASGLPADLSINATTGVISGTPGAGDIGGIPVSITASNGIGTPATQSFILTVQAGAAPIITSGTNVTFAQSSVSSFNVVATGNPAPTITETGTLPTGLNLSATGVLSGTPTDSGVFPITITATNLLGSVQQSFTITVTAAPVFTSASSTTIVLGQSVNFQATASGFPAANFTMTGNLPGGVTLDANGLLSGTPTASGTFTITITATNAIGSTDQTFTFTVNQVAAITSVNSTRFALDEIDSFQVTASGFPAPAFSTSSTLPNGITLSSSGVLSGEPTNAGTFTITIVATNGIGAPGTQTFTLTVVPPVVFTPLKIADGQVAASYSQQLTASGPAGPFTFRLASGTLPAGLTLNPNGAVRGSPSQAGTFTITAAATNGTADTGSQSYTFTIIPAPVPLSISGAPDGSAVQFLPNKTGSFALGSAIDPFANTGTSSRTAVADVNGDGVPDTIFVTGPGTPIRVAVENGASGSLLVLPFDPFGGNFLGGGFVAAGDFDGDGRAEFVITPDQGGGPRVSIFSLSGFDPKLRANYFTVDPNFRGGARAAVGDINGDHIPDLAVAAGFGGGPRVAVINGIDALTTDGFSFSDRLVGDFFAFGDDLRNGVYLAIGDVDGDGFGDLIFGAGPGGGPEVLTISGQTLVTRGSLVAVNNPISNFFVGGSDSDRSGVRVTTTDADRDNLADVVVATGADVPSGVRVYLGKNFGGGEPSHFQDLDPFQSAVLADGVFVG